MKNFQQTPKQRRVALAQAKTVLQNSRNKGFQPRPAWTSKRKPGGVFMETLVEKQMAAGHLGVSPHLCELPAFFDISPPQFHRWL